MDVIDGLIHSRPTGYNVVYEYFTVERQAVISCFRSAAEPRWIVFQIGVLLCLLHVMRITVVRRCAIDSCYLGVRRI